MQTLFYVTLQRGGRTAFLLGPYDEHAHALERVRSGRKLASATDPWSDFDAIGTSSITGDNHPQGIFGK